MSDIKCPYCGKEQEACPDDNVPDELYETECEQCEKIFGYFVDYIKTFDERALPCANGEPHKWEKISGYPEEFYKNKERCAYCSQERSSP